MLTQQAAMTAITDRVERYTEDIEFFVLGPVTHRVGDDEISLGGPKQRAVLSMLLAAGSGVVTVDELIGGVWGPDASPSYKTSVHTYISNLRVLITYDIERVGDGYRLSLPPGRLDSDVFTSVAADAAAAREVNPDTASQLARRGLSLWRGRPYADLSETHGLQGVIRSLEDARLRLVEVRIDADLDLGRHRAVIAELEALTLEHPLNEGLHGRLMLALYRDGRQADALRAFSRLRTELAETLGVDPTPTLIELEDRILQHDPGLARAQESRTEQLTFLFTDVEGSTVLWDSNPDWMRTALARHDTLITDTVDRCGGRIFKHTGDGFIAVFSEPSHAVRAATEAQRSLTATDWGAPGPLVSRMAIDAGEVEARDSDYFGVPLNRGTRLQNAAHGGQVLVSTEVHERLAGEAGIQTRNLGEHRLRGFGTPQRVFQLVIDGLDADFPELRVDGHAERGDSRQFGDAIRGYELRERIASDRLGVVYRAYQPSIGREVAVKVVPPNVANHPAFLRTFERDARTVAKLAHPHIVPIFDFWRDSDGAYIVMPYLPGGSLATSAASRLPVSKVGRVVTEIGSALAHAHRHGVIHGKVDARSVVLDRDGNAYLTGFSIGTRDEAFEANGASDHRAPLEASTDIRALASLAASLITGQESAPFEGLDQAPAGDVLTRAIGAAGRKFASVEDFVAAFPTEAPAAKPTPGGRNPFKGLAAFDESDARDFFGRAAEIDALVELVADTRMVTVVGPSGTGKSSLVRAGLIPALRAGRAEGSADWLPVVMVPGSHPFDELVTAIGSLATEDLGGAIALLNADERGLARLVRKVMRDLDGDLLLVIDQFEELYTLVDDPSRRDSFIESLIAAIDDPHSRLRVVITMRADFFDQPLLDDRLGPRIAAEHLTVSGLEPARMLEAVRGPAQIGGLELEGGLAERIVEEVRNQPGALPLMQFTLQALTETCLPGWLTHDAYERLGGVTGALAARAEAVFEALLDHDRETAEQVFVRLVTVSDESDDLRRRVRQRDLGELDREPGSVERVLGSFGQARLLTFDRDPVTRGPTVEVAHEALLREWDLLRSWIEERRSDLITHRRLLASMEEWRIAGESDDHLPTGNRLTQYVELLGQDDRWLTQAERAFVERAVARRTAERQRVRRRRRATMTVLGAATIISIGLGAIAAVQRSEAVREADVAVGRELVLEAANLIDDDPELAVMLGLEAAERFSVGGEDPRLASSVLRDANAANLVVARMPGQFLVDSHPDGELYATLVDGELAVVEMATGEIVETYSRDGLTPDEIAFTPDGSAIVASYPDADELPGTLWNRSSGDGWHFGTGDVAWNPSFVGTDLVAVITSSGVEVWDIDARTLLLSVPDATGVGADNGDLLGIGVCPEAEPCHVEVRTADLNVLREVSTDITPVFLSWSPDSTLIALSNENDLQIVDAVSGDVISAPTIERPGDSLWFEDGARLLVGAESNTRVLDARTGAVRSELLGFRGTVSFGSGKTIIPGTDLVAVAGGGDSVTVFATVSGEVGAWDLDQAPWTVAFDDGAGLVLGSQGGRSFASDHGYTFIDTATDGTEVVSGGSDAWFPYPSDGGGWTPMFGPDDRWEVRRAATGDVAYAAPENWRIFAVSDDGAMALQADVEQIPSETSCPGDGPAQIVDLSDGSTVDLPDLGCPGQAVFSGDGTRLAAAEFWSGRANRVFDTATGEQIASTDVSAIGIDLSDDGDLLFLGGTDGRVSVFDVDLLAEGATESEALVTSFQAHNNLILRTRLSRDGNLVATSAWEEPLKLWDWRAGELVSAFGGDLDGRSTHDAAFHPTEPYLAVTYPPHTVRIHTLDFDELVEISRSRLSRSMTNQECMQYLRAPCSDE